MEENQITARLADFIEKSDFSHIPPSVVETAKHLITDFMGVTAGGSRETAAKIIQEVTAAQGISGSATLIGTSLRSYPSWASLANGIAGHALDYDDVSQPMYGHPTTAVLPAALALGESLGIGGRALLEAYIIGLEVTVKLAYAMNPRPLRARLALHLHAGIHGRHSRRSQASGAEGSQASSRPGDWRFPGRGGCSRTSGQ